MPYAIAGLYDQEQNLISVLKMMVSNGAHGPSVDDTVLETLDHPGPATEQILMVLLPVGIGSVASGKAVLALSQQAATVRSVEMLCEESDISETALGSALKILLGHETFNLEKARILAKTIKTTGRSHILDHLLIHFHRDSHGKGYQIVDFLLASGASIDAGDGCVMAAEASRGNLARLGEMMMRAPSPVNSEKHTEESPVFNATGPGAKRHHSTDPRFCHDRYWARRCCPPGCSIRGYRSCWRWCWIPAGAAFPSPVRKPCGKSLTTSVTRRSQYLFGVGWLQKLPLPPSTIS
ncbi:hypothetical protein B0T18DRAFT_381 [Schizothecium vesticola]|uniref:Uncharacterized protein n=1 Tax=Schizothecium vesticola TaxID=314040 RepID=A0AA40F8J2_9PEZI|nr:hypothetical protein B0T18DRAFT_381 [Schizothecium vesticola]